MRLGLILALAYVISGCGNKAAQTGSSTEGLDEEFGSYDQTSAAAFVRDDGTTAGDKKVAVMYYAVDGEEPFYQAAVDYEVRSLRAVCDSNHPNTNWVAFVNSWMVYNNRTYMKCVGGKYSQQTLTADIMTLINTVASPTYDNTQPTAGLKIPLQHPQAMNVEFAKYPLSHPEVLWYVMDFVTTTVFPADQYSLVLHTKSHGSNQLLLAGLTPDQLKQKSDRQTSILQDYLTKTRQAALDSTTEDLDTRNVTACEAAGGRWKQTACYCDQTATYINQFYGECSPTIGKVGMGAAKLDEIGYDTIGLGAVGFDMNTVNAALTADNLGGNGLGGNGLGGNGLGGNGLGGNGLGGNGLGGNGLGGNGLGGNGLGGNGLGGNGLGGNGLGGNGLGGNGLGGNGLGGNGLGFDDVGTAGFGLYADSHFGTPEAAMVTVLEAAKAKGVTFDFIMFESCSSDFQDNASVAAEMQSMDNVGGYYSAHGSLWYRNLDWAPILDTADKFPSDKRDADIEVMLGTITSGIKNFVLAPGASTDTSTSTATATAAGH